MTDKNIVEVAVEAGTFTTLAAALGAADLVATLQSEGPFTVFAPTDDAFAAAGIDLSAVSDTDLTNLLLYHVLGVSVTAGEIGDGDTFASTAGTYGPGDSALSMLINKTGSAVSINSDATVVVADIAATNGIIHAIDKVLAPQTIVDFATKAAGTSELAGALVAADLVGALSGTDPLTVFAPVNSAFTAIATTVESLTTEQLVEVLTYHVVSGNVRSEALSVTVVPTLNTTNNCYDSMGRLLFVTLCTGKAKTLMSSIHTIKVDASILLVLQSISHQMHVGLGQCERNES